MHEFCAVQDSHGGPALPHGSVGIHNRIALGDVGKRTEFTNGAEFLHIRTVKHTDVNRVHVGTALTPPKLRRLIGVEEEQPVADLGSVADSAFFVQILGICKQRLVRPVALIFLDARQLTRQRDRSRRRGRCFRRSRRSSRGLRRCRRRGGRRCCRRRRGRRRCIDRRRCRLRRSRRSRGRSRGRCIDRRTGRRCFRCRRRFRRSGRRCFRRRRRLARCYFPGRCRLPVIVIVSSLGRIIVTCRKA